METEAQRVRIPVTTQGVGSGVGAEPTLQTQTLLSPTAWLTRKSLWFLETLGSDFFLKGLVLLEGGPSVEDLNSEQQTPQC